MRMLDITDINRTANAMSAITIPWHHTLEGKVPFRNLLFLPIGLHLPNFLLPFSTALTFPCFAFDIAREHLVYKKRIGLASSYHIVLSQYVLHLVWHSIYWHVMTLSYATTGRRIHRTRDKLKCFVYSSLHNWPGHSPHPACRKRIWWMHWWYTAKYVR